MSSREHGCTNILVPENEAWNEFEIFFQKTWFKLTNPAITRLKFTHSIRCDSKIDKKFDTKFSIRHKSCRLDTKIGDLIHLLLDRTLNFGNDAKMLIDDIIDKATRTFILKKLKIEH